MLPDRFRKEAFRDTETLLKIVLATAGMALVIASATFALTGSQEGTLYMRGDSSTVNSFSAYRLNGTQSSTARSAFVEKGDDGTSTVYWGSRYWAIDENGSQTEITSGNPVAVVSRGSDGSGIQSATYTPPETDLNPGDAVIAKVYVSVGSNDYRERAQHITPVLDASKLLNRQWNVNYYTERTSVSQGAPWSKYTRGTFYWGTGTYNSRIEGFNYSLARVEGEQLSPKSEVDTYPGNDFQHEVEATCRASNCKDVKIYPQLCQGRSCTGFSNIDGSEGVSWNKNSHSFGDLSRGETATYSFTATPDTEGDYRIRFNITGGNVLNNETSSEILDADIADVNLTAVEHENQVENGIAEYETSDNISFVNTTLTAGGGTAFNVTSRPEFTEPDLETASWGPSSTKNLGDLSDGQSGEAKFSSYDIPLGADAGTYNFTVNYDWENTGPETNSTVTFRVVDVRDSFSSQLTEGNVLQGEFSQYHFNLTNRWSTSISDVNVSVNCRGNITCNDIGSTYFSSLSSGQKAQTEFNVTTQNTDSGFYDVNVTVNYTNPGEQKNWKDVENEVLKVSEGGTLVTTVEDAPDRITRGEDGNLSGTLENTGNDASDVYLNWTLPSGWTNSSGSLSSFWNTVSSGETVWNNITASTDITADRGVRQVDLTSNSSAGDRGDFTFREIAVYANTSSSLSLNTSDAARGEAVTATVDLSLDTGADLTDQSISFRDEYSGDFLGSSVTDATGVSSIVFTVPEKWGVTNHSINGSYSRNNTVYTNPSSDEELLEVHDFPLIENVSATPEVTGYGFNVTVNASVTDEDGVSDVELTVEQPDGDTQTYGMENLSDGEFRHRYGETWENGQYSYTVSAIDDAGYSNESASGEFLVKANATKNVVTEFDTYGPNEEVLLERSRNVTRNSSIDYSALASRKYAEDLFSSSFNTLIGTSGVHTETHELDSSYFTMTERDGSPPDTPDEFEGFYTYETSLDSFERIDINSLGSVDGGTWNVDFRNYATSSYDNAFTVSETADTWKNQTFCSGAVCSDYVQNGEIEVRVFVQTDRGTPQSTYSVDYQELRIDGNSSEFSKQDEPGKSTVGQDRSKIKRLYRKFELADLPNRASADITGAELVFNVSGGFGTGELYHTENFSSSSSAEDVYRDGAPPESMASRPIGSFQTSEGFKRVEVTSAVNSSFEAGKRFVGFQFRQQGEDNYYELERPAYLVVNYTADSELFDTGTTDIRGYLVMRVQREKSDGSWENVGFPVVDRSNGAFKVENGFALDLASIWSSNGAFNTGLNEEGDYRVLSRLVDVDDNTLVTDDGERIKDSYRFQVRGAQLNLTDIEHENQYDYSVNEYETRDNLQWVNVTINNSREEAVNASIDLETLDEENNKVSWGPDSLNICGDIATGESCEEKWGNSTSGYKIPQGASSGTFTFRWNTTLKADNSETSSNYSVTFLIHDVPSNFSSVIQDSDNKILRNESTLYNFTVENPWSGPLDDLNVSINCDDSELNCRELGTGDEKAQLGTLGSGSSQEVSFNVTTDENTDVGNYDINATVEYLNPGTEQRVWENRENKILQVRIPGALLNVTQSPEKVVRGNSGYTFKSYNNNTYDENLTNSTTSWSLPPGWNNQSGNLDVFEDVQETGELLYNNFTAEIDASTELGQTRIDLSATNDQGRIDNDFVRVDVHAGTSLQLKFNETDPAVEEPVRVSGFLEYSNGTAIQDETISFRDETENLDIGSGSTNSTGGYTLTYQPDRPLGNHTINVSFSGSSEEYLEPSFQEENMTVHDRPNVTNVSATPEVVGFGFNTTINASVADSDSLSSVDLEVTYPNGSVFSFPMTNPAGETYEYNFSDTWQFGTYGYDVVATDSFGKTSRSGSGFLVFIKQSSSIQTEKFDYFPAEFVNLTDRGTSWWNKDYDYRRIIQVNETSGNELVKYPTRLQIDNLGSKVQSGCEDLRVVEDFVVKDIHVASCNPSGTTELYLSNNITASSTEEDTYLYYGNSSKSAYPEDMFAYRIEDSGTYDPGQTALDNTHTYNDGDAVFRQIDITVYGDSLSGKVDAYNFRNDTWMTLYQGNPTSGQNVVNRLILQDPRFSKFNVQLEDTSNNAGPVSYEYNYTTPDYTDAAALGEEDRLPSRIRNTGNTSFRGHVELQVLTNTSGTWELVKTQYNESSPSELLTGASINFASLWNNDPFYTGTREEGFYRARFQLKSEYDSILQDSLGDIVRDYVFRLNPPQTEVNVEQIKVYNVSGSGNQKSDTSDLEDSGLNSTLQVKGGNTYRFDVVVNNSDSAGTDWKIGAQDLIKHFNFNSSWTVDDTNDIFYTNNTNEYTGGLFTGDVKWNTSSGTVKPGNNATFSFIVDIPNKGEKRDIEFRVNDTAFVERDYSRLEVIKREQIPPDYLEFQLNDTLVTRGEPFLGYAKWDEEIDSSEAEYNSTTSVLNNFTVTPHGTWTNTTVNTDSSWVRGNHTFRFYASDANDNQNMTYRQVFSVLGLASITGSDTNSSTVEPGESLRFSCQVGDDRGNAVQDYNVSFYNETSLLGYNSTNSTGGASIQYSSTEIGFQDLKCEIQRNLDKFYDTEDPNATETIRVAESGAPDYFEYGANRSRVFKTSKNDTAGFYSKWTDNRQLDYASLVRGRGVYSFTENEYIHEINSNTFNLFGALNGTNPINEGFDSNDHYMYGTWTGVNGEKLDAYHGSESNGGWNNAIIANATSQYCAIQTTPVNKSRCQNSGNLVSFLALDETGSKAWDHVGGNHGELKGGIFQGSNGYINNAYDFDGSDDYINLSDKPSEKLSSSSYTLTAWIKNPGDSKEVIIASNQQDGTVRAAFRVNQELEIRVDGSTYTGTTDVRGSAWTHVVFAYNSSNHEGKFYVNGSSEGNFQDDRVTVADGDVFSIGQRYSGSIDNSSTSEHFDGEMDNVRIYDRQLNQTEIQQLFGKDPRLGDEQRLKGDLPSGFIEEPLSGSEDWSNLTIDIPEDYPVGDYDWSFYANDTSSNINSTAPIGVDVWAWAFIDETRSGADKNPVGTGNEFTFFCNYREGNGTGIPSYNVTFYDNDTADGSFRKLGVNDTRTGSNKGFAQWTKSYADTGAYEMKCNVTESSTENVKPFEGFKNFSETIEVKLGDVLPPYLVNGNYGLNDSAVYKGVSPVKSYAEWNDSISWAEAEFNTTDETLTTDRIPGPYSNNWTNYSFQPKENWSVGPHVFKTYANDTDGNLNDTLSYLEYDVWGFSNVTWKQPTGSVVKSDSTKLVCGVGDNQTGAPIENYQVSFYDDSNNLIGTNTTGADGDAVYYYNTSGMSNTDKTWSCQIEDETDLFYNASADNADSETVTLVDEANGILDGTLTEPASNSVLAQNRTFTANVSVTCRDADCGDVDSTLRHNASGSTAGTAVSSSSDRPFHTVGSNPKSCDTDLRQGESCFTSWTVNATGAVDSLHSLDAQLDGSMSKTNDTDDKQVRIDIVLIFNLNYSEVDFPSGAPSVSSPNYVEGPGNSGGKYSAELDEDSNDATGGVWIKGTQLNHTGSSNPDYRHIPPTNTTYTIKPSCSYSASDSIFRDYTQILGSLDAGGSFTNCFFQEIPQAKAAGIYQGNISIKVNATN